jgi:hypothetical protein
MALRRGATTLGSSSSSSFPPLLPRIAPPASSLPVVVGDLTDRFCVLNKPCGTSVQLSRWAPSVESTLTASPGHRTPYFPHRLDRASSGLLAVAFHRPTVAALNASLARREWEKRYRVLVRVGGPSESGRVRAAVEAARRPGGGGGSSLSALLRTPPAPPAAPPVPREVRRREERWAEAVATLAVGSDEGVVDGSKRELPRTSGALAAATAASPHTLMRSGLIVSLVVPMSVLSQALSGSSSSSWSSSPSSSSADGGALPEATRASANFVVSVRGPIVLPEEDGEGASLVGQEGWMATLRESLLARGGRGGAGADALLRRIPASSLKLAVTRFRLVAAWDADAAGTGAGGGKRAATPSSSSRPLVLPGAAHPSSSPSLGPAGGFALFEAEPLTGRTHQLRVHFSECGLPIVGDRYYTFGGLDNGGEVAREVESWDAGVGTWETGAGSIARAAFPSGGDLLGLQAFTLAFPYPRRREGGETGPEPQPSSPASSQPAPPPQRRPAVRGALWDAQGRIRAVLPRAPAEWRIAEMLERVQRERVGVADEVRAKEWGVVE